MRERLARARARLADERGFALPTVVLGVAAALGLGSAMVVSSLSATSGTTRDANTKSAFAIAEAGVGQAIFRYNRFDTFADPTRPCLAEGDGGQVILEPVQANGWCRAVTAAAAGGTYSYSVRPDSTDKSLTIVSTGYRGGLERRVMVAAEYSEQPGNGGLTPFGDFEVIADDSITIENGSTISADVATNGTLTVTNGGKLHCEQAEANSTSFGKDAPCPVGQPSFELPGVDTTVVQADNDNGLLPGTCRSWSAATKELTITCSTTFGVNGETHDFFLCKLTNNSQITIAAGATVNFWFGTPEECGGNTTPVVFADGSKLRTPSGDPVSTIALIVDESSTPTTIHLSAGGWGHWPEADDNFVIYAPTTNVSMDKGQHMYAAIAAKTITTASGGSFTNTSHASTWELPGSTGGPVPHYSASQFLECIPGAATSSAPDAGC